MGNGNGKTKSNKDKLLEKLSGGTGGKLSGGRTIIVDEKTGKLDKAMITKIYNKALKSQGGSGGRTISVNDFMAALKKVRDAKKKGKPHLKHGGKAKKMRAYSKGGKAK